MGRGLATFGVAFGFGVEKLQETFFETFQTGYSPCSFLKFSISSFCANFGFSLSIQLITTFSRYPSFRSIELIFRVVLPPYPARYPPKTLFVGFLDLPMYKMSDAGFPVKVQSARTKTQLLSNGRDENDSPFNGTNSAKPFSLSDKEFIWLIYRARNLTFPT